VKARDYVVGTAVGIVPGAIAFATLGATANDPGSPAFVAAAALAVVLVAAGALIARRGSSAPGS
ncbi:MAG: TVP38/TMEM64 family protein, partial [Solirubrobacteraceae bacterium]